MTSKRRILILDDEAKVAFFLQESLEALGHDFEVVSVSSTHQALQEISRQRFDLVVTDQRLPDMNGLELIRQVQEHHPETQFILITAYGTEDLLAQARDLGAYRYFTKPFHIEDFVQTVLDALENDDGRPGEPLLEGHASVLHDRLEELRREVGALCVLAATATGSLVAQAGVPSGLELDPLLRLATDSFAASLAMVHYLGDIHSGNLTYYEGAGHDVYMANVGDDLFLLIIFDRRIQTSRIGIVWLYARRAVENLRRVTASYQNPTENQAPELLETSKA